MSNDLYQLMKQPEFFRQTEGHLPISEMFYSIQGEGPTMGCPSIFIRLQGCNLLCSWCDTINVWKNGNYMTYEEILKRMTSNKWITDAVHIVVTGGEPTLRQKTLIGFFEMYFSTMRYLPYIEVETNGTIWPENGFDAYIRQYNISPKLKNSGMDENRRIHKNVIQRYIDLYENGKIVAFKFVVKTREDVNEIINDYIDPFSIPKDIVWLMPCASTREELKTIGEEVVEAAKENGYHYSSRLQIEA